MCSSDLKMLAFTQKLLESILPLICTALVVEEDSYAIALDTIPQIKIALSHSFERFKLVKVQIEKVDLLCGYVQGRVIESISH